MQVRSTRSQSKYHDESLLTVVGEEGGIFEFGDVKVMLPPTTRSFD